MDEKEIKKRTTIAMWVALGCIIGVGIYWFADYMEGPESVDVDCLIDTMMYLDLDNVSMKYGRGVINEDWTVGQIRQLYAQKGYKAKTLLKGFLDIFLKRCEK